MTTKLTAKRFRIRRAELPPVPPPQPRALAREADAASLFEPEDDGFGPGKFPTVQAPAGGGTDLDALRHEGLTGRQLRLARRVAQKHGLPATSDFDAVRLLRQAGIDPFQRTAMIELVTSDGKPAAVGTRALAVTADSQKLPQTIKPIQVPSTEVRAETNHAADILRIQQDIARRRRRKSMLLMVRLAFFVGLPTLFAAWYYYLVATPLYATKSEFVIQQAQNPSTPGVAGLLTGTQFATSQDSIAVQGYLQSRDAMQRLDQDAGFRAIYSSDHIDPIQRLSPDASTEAAYKVYKRNVRISYDPTEGIIKMEVIAPDPVTAATWAKALISYAEQQVDQLTQRLRGDQMEGATKSFEEAQREMLAAQRKVVELQEKSKVLSSEVEVSLITTQIGQLDTQITQDRLSLSQMESNATPNLARMEPLKRRIAAMEDEVTKLRARLTEDGADGQSLAQVQSDLLTAQAEVQTRQLILSGAVASMETARTDANRQTRYLSVSVNPVPPDEATYPRAFENTIVAMLFFAGLYLMISMTSAILREQVAS